MATNSYLDAGSRKESARLARLDFREEVISEVRTPAFVVSEQALERNLKIISTVRKRTGAKILLALKAFSMYEAFPVIAKHLDGVCASGPNEARLGKEEFKKAVHTFAPAYSSNDIKCLVKTSDTIIFNSISQWKKYREFVRSSGRKIEIGLRVNPGYSEVKVDLYNPVSPEAGLGVFPEELVGEDLSLLDGLHFHALCEQGAETLASVLAAFEKNFAPYLKKVRWVNFGGGHHITRKGYDLGHLVKIINSFKERYGVQVHIEPGEAIAMNAGIMVSSVLDILPRTPKRRKEIALLDTSAEDHMPDVLAMPYRPEILQDSGTRPAANTYIFRGQTCLAGDIIGEYKLAVKLRPGDRVVFLDMAIYTMVKTTTFNGVNLPSIYFLRKSGMLEETKRFGYKDYKGRL